MLSENIADYQVANPGFEANSVRFRSKSATTFSIKYGWFANGIAIDWRKDPYMTGFLECITVRECCYHCRYAYSARATDLTICDFWGLGRDSKLARNGGVSAVLVNSAKGNVAVDRIKSIAEIEQRTVQEAVEGNGRLQRPTSAPMQRKQFMQLYPTMPLRQSIDIVMKPLRRRRKIKQIITRLRRLIHI
jgi:hypothetical protein